MMREVEVPVVAGDALPAEVEAVESGRTLSEPYGNSSALETIAAALRGLPGLDQLSPEARVALVAHLDDDAHRAIAPDSARSAPEQTGAAPDERVVGMARDLFGALLDAYHDCLSAFGESAGPAGESAVLRACHVRLVRAGAQRVKWERCAGGPAHAKLWQWLGASFTHGVSHGAAGVAGGAAGSLATSVEREYLRAVAFYSAALEHLSPALINAIDRLIEFALPMLQLQADAAQGAVYCLPHDLAAAPRRMVRVSHSRDGAWFLYTRVAVGALHELAERVQDGGVPVGLESACGGRSLMGGIQHLLRHWSDASPVRRYRRHMLGGKLTAVRGIEDLRQLFTGESVSYLAEWEFRDASRGGIGASVPAGASVPVNVGELVGILPHDGEAWQLGVVRRAWLECDAMQVGLEALSQRPVLASIDDGLVRTEVFLCDPLLRGEAVRIAAPVNTLRPGIPVFVTANGSIQKLKPLDAAMAGNGFELRVYQVL
jgi:hypothetical protein